MKHTKYPKLKKELKDLAKEIKLWKFLRKPVNRKDTRLQQWDVDYNVFRYKREFRHKHIAYCLLRGRSYEQIEQPRDDNKPDMIYVQMIMDEYEQPKTKFRTVQH
jgi:hypothetical protein